MTSERFAALADAYGGDINRWPESERQSARNHILSYPDARQVLLTQAGLDAALQTWALPGPSASLAGVIARRALERQALLWRVRVWLSGASAAIALAGGVAAGMSIAIVPTSPSLYRTSGLYELQVLGTPLDVQNPTSLSDGL